MKLHARQILGAAAVVAVASLAATTVPATANPASVASKFADQGRDANLTSKQIAELQKEVEKQVAVTGGRQIALNKIAVNGGEMGIPVPGEDRVLDLAASKAKATKVYAGCRQGNFCGWKGRNGTGADWQRGACNVDHEIPDGWNSGGSWQNNQTRGLVAEFRGKRHNHLSYTPPAPTGIVNGDWAPVWYVRAC
ncbi:hypothetical protein [Streptomyces melanogenes]|uniref:Secreted protein n=1 Tax=Streptomyces melanogenes TaxID=67326 RepID=A0ABZ1XBG1_9ACTN|nr:hypothetical protein [Streptomyces melanogenes]